MEDAQNNHAVVLDYKRNAGAPLEADNPAVRAGSHCAQCHAWEPAGGLCAGGAISGRMGIDLR
ncbi:high-potential iron-sulfur protein [Pararhizobium sp. LjRoot235]|uniref:high-potential iron-sulfur protein n=1 Tax=Pararhizobium sp. LjRoot235 TaxID=3342291 RepID=UPI003F507DED